MSDQPLTEKANSPLDQMADVVKQINPTALAFVLAIILFLIGGVLNPDFLNIDQAINIVRLAAFLGIIAAGQTLVIISGGEGIDLSAGVVVTLGTVVMFQVSDGQNSMIIPGLLATLAAGAVVGFLNGFGIVLLRIPPLVMTLAMAGVVQGAIQIYTEGLPQGGTPPLLTEMFAEPLLWKIPGVLIFWIIFGLGMWILLTRTLYGKQLFAIGTNRATAKLSGLWVKPLVWLTFTLSGMLSAFGGFMLLSFDQQPSLNTQASADLLFRSIAAVVIGGTVLAGGRGGYWGTMAGALLLQVIVSLLRAQQLAQAYQLIILGATLVALTSLYGREGRLRQ